MSMDFSEFKRRFGAEPLGGDPELRHARDSSPEFEEFAQEAEQLEARLTEAFTLPVPDDLLGELQAIPQQSGRRASRGWQRMALAASLLLAVGAAGITWNQNRGWDSVEDYLADHYQHDGPALLAGTAGEAPELAQSILGEFDVRATPELAQIINVIKFCPTPDGKGVHMVLNTQNGPVTVFYMPATSVQDGQTLAFDDMEAVLVELESGSAAIIGPKGQDISQSYAIVRNAIVPTG